MSNEQSFSALINYDNRTTQLKDASNVTIGYKYNDETGILCVDNTTSWGSATLTDSAKSIFPNSTVMTTKVDLYYSLNRPWYLSGATTYGKIEINGTSYLEKSTTDNTSTVFSDSYTLSINRSATIKCFLKASKKGCRGFMEAAILTFYFTRYDFTATAGDNVSSASVSSSTGYDGDTVTYSCELASGATFDGWYNGSTLVSTSQTYTHTVNGADLTLTAKATASSEPQKSFSTIYGNEIIINQNQNTNVPITYGSSTIYTLDNDHKIIRLDCKDQVMSNEVLAAGRTLNCQNQISAYHIPMMYCHGSWELNKGLTQGTSVLSDADGFVTTPYIPVNGKINVTVSTGGTRNGSMLNEYNSSFNYSSYWGHSSSTRTFTLDTDASYIRCTFLKSALENCYIYDNTNSKVLYKGGSVQ